MKKAIFFLTSMALVITMLSIVNAGMVVNVTQPTAEDIPEPASVQDVVNLELAAFANEIISGQTETGSISGELINITFGEQRMVVISLETEAPDKDFTDGDITYQYGNWVILDDQNQIIRNGEYSNVSGNYSEQITISTSRSGNFVLIPYIIEHKISFNMTSATWSEDEGFEVLEKEGALVSVQEEVIIIDDGDDDEEGISLILWGIIIGIFILIVIVTIVLVSRKK